VCRHSSHDSSSDGAREMMGESKVASPPPQMVATSEGAAPVPSPQEAQVVAPQKAASGPSESPSEHVSTSVSCHGGSPRASEKFSCLVLSSSLRGEPPSVFVCEFCFCSFVLGAAPKSFSLLVVLLPAAFCAGCQATGAGAPGAGGQPPTASRYLYALVLLSFCIIVLLSDACMF
jgi:hypothetical protein